MRFDVVKVFSATKARERNELGDRVTRFLEEYDGDVVDLVVRQSSDREFHCLSVILFGRKSKRRRDNGRQRNSNKTAHDRNGT